MIEHIARLDFTRAARELARAVDALLQASPEIDPCSAAVWGYCTGGTLAWLAACLRGDLAAADPLLPEPTGVRRARAGHAGPPRRPALAAHLPHAVRLRRGRLRDAAGAARGPPGPDRPLGRRRRGAPLPGRATHADTAPWGDMRNEEADRASWEDTTAFLRAHTELH